ncbi:IclR family transcriptional regulator [Corynebacterium halotolerans]|uniref:IclR family transcriptional regulator n=1 Tax=Corynebacterium halotolerans YIM 70093 = DSM 44683 TaxID=1121362 RepID=M1NIC6_9CORY|nr:IclR family transcriptional regulator [Corynebacterium halotolerans]AGF71163.1 IclR family transcriptional regulator [Corynebacterium halotolerans YIM 70093 = DSM 44683]
MASNEKKSPAPQKPLLVLGKISAILDAFTLTRPTLTLGEIREATGMPTSTVQRLVTNLVAQGFLDREDDSFRIGMKMAYWAAPATRGVAMLDLFAPLLKALRDHTGETVCFFQSEREYRVCVAMAETRHALRRAMHVGAILPLHAGSAGQVLLAWNPELLKQVLSAPLPPLTEFTITSSEELESEVHGTRRNGFSITIGQRDDAGAGMSAPVFDSTGTLVGAVTISGPTLRMPYEVCAGWVEDLLSTAERMTRLIGGRFPDEADS